MPPSGSCGGSSRTHRSALGLEHGERSLPPEHVHLESSVFQQPHLHFERHVNILAGPRPQEPIGFANRISALQVSQPGMPLPRGHARPVRWLTVDRDQPTMAAAERASKPPIEPGLGLPSAYVMQRKGCHDDLAGWKVRAQE